MTQSQLKALKSDIQSFLKKDILDLEKKVLYKGWNASIDDLEKRYIGLFEIIKIWIENYKGEAIEIKNILGKKQTKKYIDKYHQKFLLNEKNKG